MKIREVDPRVIRLEKLVRDVRTGDIRLPKFQRPFVWNREDIIRLFDSVYQGYPIGSLLLWLTNEKLASEQRIGDIEINQRPDIYPTHYVLDGQQRLSTLCGALYWDGEDFRSKWNVVFDLDTGKFIHPEEPLINHFPLRNLLETRDFLAQCTIFAQHPNANQYYTLAQQLLSSIKDYNIAVVFLGDMNLNQVAPVFERINSSGRRLTIVDLMRAATWKEGEFDLNDAIKAVRNACENKNFSDIQEGHILRSISAACDLGINKGDIDKLRGISPDRLSLAASRCVAAYQLAVDFLTTELPLSSLSYVPYNLQLTYLVEFFNRCPTPTLAQITALRQWFWKSSFSRYFGTTNTAQISKDLASIRAAADGDSMALEIPEDIKIDIFLRDGFALNKATSKAYALLLAQNNPRNLVHGSLIDTKATLAITNRHEFHHIFPQAMLKTNKYSETEISYHVNICLLKAGSNKWISDERPSVYFNHLINQLGDGIEDILNSNFISEEALFAALNDDYEKFIDIRYETLSLEINRLVK